MMTIFNKLITKWTFYLIFDKVTGSIEMKLSCDAWLSEQWALKQQYSYYNVML